MGSARRRSYLSQIVRRCIEAAQVTSLERGDFEDKLTDALIGAVIETVRAGRPPGDRGTPWELLREHKAFIEDAARR